MFPVNMEDFSKRAKAEIPNFLGIKFSSKDLVDLIGIVFNGVNVVYGCDEVITTTLHVPHGLAPTIKYAARY